MPEYYTTYGGGDVTKPWVDPKRRELQGVVGWREICHRCLANSKLSQSKESTTAELCVGGSITFKSRPLQLHQPANINEQWKSQDREEKQLFCV